MTSADPLAKLFQSLEEPVEEEPQSLEIALIAVISKTIDEVTEYLRDKSASVAFHEKLKNGIGEKGSVKVTAPRLSIDFQLAIRTNALKEIRVRLDSDYLIDEKAEKVLEIYRKKKLLKTHYISDVLLLTSKPGAKLSIEIIYRNYKKPLLGPLQSLFNLGR
ncbi:hypothetical protein [Klebsiella pneumoniae]|uniref:hypothetical protein n=1 Tax=Klebsiella pneumoniae TaxID=573 RepID=UPI000D1B385E|nr:hypothetical protein [Klebsiella pneumoniae]